MRFNRSLCVTIPFILKKKLEPRVWKQNLLKMFTPSSLSSHNDNVPKQNVAMFMFVHLNNIEL